MNERDYRSQMRLFEESWLFEDEGSTNNLSSSDQSDINSETGSSDQTDIDSETDADDHFIAGIDGLNNCTILNLDLNAEDDVSTRSFKEKDIDLVDTNFTDSISIMCHTPSASTITVSPKSNEGTNLDDKFDDKHEDLENICEESQSDKTKSTTMECWESDESIQSYNSLKTRTQVNHAQHSVGGHQIPCKSKKSKRNSFSSILPNGKSFLPYRRKSNRAQKSQISKSKTDTPTCSSPKSRKTECEVSDLESEDGFHENQKKFSFAVPQGRRVSNAIIDRQWGNLAETVQESFPRQDSFKKKAKSVFTGTMQKRSSVIRSMRRQRGLCFKFELVYQTPENKSAIEMFQSHCKKPSLSKSISNVTLTGRSGYFMNWDKGKWSHHGPIMKPFLNRLRKNTEKGKCPTVRYLATGPSSQSGVYYAELSNNEYWWVNFDQDFHDAVQTLPIHRVAFGNPYPGSNGKPSWIVLAKDGRSVWKGIPTLLHKTLSSRDPSLCAACEVSLGPSDSFFIKFLSGEIDYCLPANMANKCENVEKRGGVITNLLLHVDCHGFIMRHTELTKSETN